MEWVGVDNHSGDVDKVLGLLECVCQRPLYEMIASVGSEWRFGGIDLRLLGCLFSRLFPGGQICGCGGGKRDSTELANKATWASILQEALSSTDLGKQTGTAAGGRRGHEGETRGWNWTSLVEKGGQWKESTAWRRFGSAAPGSGGCLRTSRPPSFLEAPTHSYSLGGHGTSVAVGSASRCGGDRHAI